MLDFKIRPVVDTGLFFISKALQNVMILYVNLHFKFFSFDQ